MPNPAAPGRIRSWKMRNARQTSLSGEVFYAKRTALDHLYNRQSGYLELLDERLVVFDGAMGTNLDRLDLTPEHFGGARFAGCNDHLNLSHPNAVESVHRAFLNAGVDVIETNTFRANRFTLTEFGLEDKVREINLAGAQIARRCAVAFDAPDQPHFVAGSMGPTGKLLSISMDRGEQINFDEIRTAFSWQAAALLEGGVDLLLLETMQDILEVKAAVLGIRDAFGETGREIPIQVQVTLDANGHMLPGTDVSAAATILSGLPVDVIGINCSTGPEAMRGSLGVLSRETRLPISCLPNAGMPVNRGGKAVYPLSAGDFANSMAEFAHDFGLSVVGGCCGTTSEHLLSLVEKIRDTPAPKRDENPEPKLASSFHSVAMHQKPAPLIIGERLNTQGSRAFKELMQSGDYDAAVQIAADQMKNGAHALDVCTALTENDREGERMEHLVRLLSSQVDAPLVIDSTEPEVMERALEAAPGRPLLNSINLESGEEKARRVLALARDFNAAVIALTIDESGMAKTADDKLRVALRMRELATGEFRLREDALIFDPLTFTLASGDRETAGAGVETLEALRLIKTELPGSLTCLGVSNISYGLKARARAVLNSVFLYHALLAGLDMAILNPAHLLPYPSIPEEERQLAENLIFNRGENALQEYIHHFSVIDGMQITTDIPETTKFPLEERIRQRILQREQEGLADDLDAFIHQEGANRRASALKLLNTVLLPAMKEVGDQFGRGELILPFVLGSSEVMRAATEHLEAHLAGGEQTHKGKLVLATVYGDVHDIGKNLVKTILANNGYEVIDLGKQVPVEEIVSRAVESGADAVGLSALLVSTSQQMPLVAAELGRRGADIPVLIGGAAVNAEFAQQVAAGSDGKPYPGGVFYCRDAFDALKLLENLEVGSIQTKAEGNPEKKSIKGKVDFPAGNRYESAELPIPPFKGPNVIENIPLDILFEYLNQHALYRISWGVGSASGEKWEKYQSKLGEKLAAMRAELKEVNWLSPRAAYGYWPCQADGDALVIYEPQSDERRELLRFELERQPNGERLCLADYFVPTGSGVMDTAVFQIVSMGEPSADHIRRLQDAGDITAAYFAHGLAVQLTEAAAKWLHARIRSELSIPAEQGKRYSWGYPGVPDLSQHELLFKLLPAERLGISLTTAWQFIPEYTTAALVVHHPRAEFFKMA